MNTWTGLGRLVKDPETNYTQQGKVYTRFTLAVNRNYKNADGSQDTDFIDCVAWGKTAETIGNHVHKGQRLLVEGTLNIRTYEGKDGVKHRSADINVRNFNFIERADKKGFGEDMGHVMDEPGAVDISNVPF